MTEHPTDQGPLAGVRMLDLATAIAGPFAGSLMADQGAEVIKVETPGMGDILRYVGANRNGVSAINQITNRGKRSIALNLKSEQGVDILKRLAGRHDVMMHNFRPGVVERLGIDYEAIKAVNPDIIYISVYGFGHEGPAAGKRAYDNVVQAYSGLAYNQANEAGEPVQNYQAIADKLTALTAAQAITSALYARSQGRGGQHIRLNMLDSVVHFLWMDAAGTATFLEEGADEGQRVAKGVPLIRFKNGWGQAAPLTDTEFHGLCRAFGVDSESDPRIQTVVDRRTNRDAAHKVIEEVRQRAAEVDVDDGIALMEAEDVPCAKAMKLEELPADPQAIANGTFVQSDHPLAGRIQEPRSAATFEGTPSGVGTPVASLGEHTEAILRELGLDGEIETLRENGVVG